MKRFAALCAELEVTPRPAEQIAALAGYFRAAAPADAAWALHCLTGRPLKRLADAPSLRAWAAEALALPPWLVDASVAHVGDAVEAVSLLLDTHRPPDLQPVERHLATWMDAHLRPLAATRKAARGPAVIDCWRALPPEGVFVFNRLLTGGPRLKLAPAVVVQALAEVSEVEIALLTHRLLGDWAPSAAAFTALIAPGDGAPPPSQPYPFAPSPRPDAPEPRGAPADWHATWRWPGERAQLIRRAGEAWLWSTDDTLLTARYPEVVAASESLPDGTVLDGTLVAVADLDAPTVRPLPAAQRQRRARRKTVTKALLAEVPVTFVADDLLAWADADLRARSQAERRAQLEAALATPIRGLHLAAEVAGQTPDWAGLRATHAGARALGADGLVLAHRARPYPDPRWAWPAAPITFDAVLLYAQARGRRGRGYASYTFGVWQADALVTIAKVEAGLDAKAQQALDQWIRAHVTEKFGPVRAVLAAQVVELAVDDLQRSKRHKSGLAVRGARMLRWRRDQAPEAAARLASLEALLDD